MTVRMREFFTCQADHFGFLWKYQVFSGVLLILAGLAVVWFPMILVALVAAAVVMAGIGLIAAGWRMRRLEQRSRGVSRLDAFEW